MFMRVNMTSPAFRYSCCYFRYVNVMKITRFYSTNNIVGRSVLLNHKMPTFAYFTYFNISHAVNKLDINGVDFVDSSRFAS